MATIKARIGGLRSGTSALWTGANPVLLAGEPAFETDTKRFRIGDGVTAYNTLPFITLNAAGYQASSVMLDELSGLGTAQNKGFYTPAPNEIAEFDLAPFARTFLDDADAAAVRDTLEITTLLAGKAPAAALHTIWLPAGSFIPTTTNGATYSSEELAANDVMVQSYQFSATTDQKIQTMIAMPKSWDEGTITAQFLWRQGPSAGTGDVVWGIRALALGNDDAMDAAFGVPQTVTDPFIAAGDLHITATTSVITPAGSPAEGDMLVIEVFRDADAAADTYNGACRLIGVRLLYSTDAGDDT